MNGRFGQEARENMFVKYVEYGSEECDMGKG
jgi:hypothetical protein